MNSILIALAFLAILMAGFTLIAIGGWIQAVMRWKVAHGQMIAEILERLSALERKEIR